MQTQTVRVEMRYDRAELTRILRYVKAHDVDVNGRYDIKNPPYLNIWTHTWNNPGCRAESCLMFSLEFDWDAASLMSVTLHPGFGWETFKFNGGQIYHNAWIAGLFGMSGHQNGARQYW